jgi:D-alanyl-D-alanine carboxypeptidase (penicillin-binding protein 5/6)
LELNSNPSLSASRDRRTRLSALVGLVASIFAALALIGGQAFGQGGANQEALAPPSVTASSVFVMNAETGQVLYAKNPDTPFRILSLTKLITAYVLINQMGDRLSDTVTINWPHLVPGSTAGLKRGDIWTLQNLLYGMVLVSGNDAAMAIADHVGRFLLSREDKHGDSFQRFVKQMRTASANLGASHAQFADPYGLSPDNQATARDVGLIAARVFTDSRLLPAWRCTQRTLHIEGPHARAVTLKTTIEILGEEGVIGAKTGSHVSKNIYNLVTAWRAPNGETIVGVVLGAASHPARYDDMHAIMAALPQDFPALAEPATGATFSGDAGAGDCR